MKTARLLVLWLVLWTSLMALVGGTLAATGAPPADTGAPARTSYTFPFSTLPYGAPAVQVKVNDKIMGTFLIDTGASANMITDTMAAKLGLKPQVLPLGRGPVFPGGKPAAFVSPLKLQIGPLTTGGGAAVVVPAAKLASSPGGGVDGVLSMQALRYFALDIDFAQRQITMWYPNGLTDAAVKQAGFGGVSAVPLVPNIPDAILYDPAKAAASVDAYWSLLYSVPVQVGDGVRVSRQNLVLDTGSGVTIFPSGVSASLRLKRSGSLETPDLMNGIQAVDYAEAPLLQLGDVRLLNRTVGIITKGRDSPVLGVDVLSGYRVLMDFGAKRMYLKPDPGAAPAEAATFPFTAGGRDGQAPVAQAVVNGTETASVLIDPGFSHTVLSAEVAARLKLPLQPVLAADKPVVMGGKPLQQTVIDSIRLGAVKFTHGPVFVLPESVLSARFGQRLDGVIGVVTLQSAPVLIDYPARRISIWPSGGLTPTQLRQAGFAGTPPEPLTLDAGHGVFTAPAEVGEGTARVSVALGVDTGGGPSILTQKAAKQLGLTPGGPEQPMDLLHPEQRARAAMVGTLRSGGVTVRAVPVRVYTDDADGGSASLELGLFSHCRVLLDFPSQKMYIQRASPQATPGAP